MMYKILTYFVALFVAAFGAGEISFLHSPPSIKFHGDERVNESLLKEIYSAALGFTTTKNSDWSGLSISNPFHFAEAIVCLQVDGVDTLDKIGKHRYSLITDEEEDVTWRVLRRRVRSRYPSLNNTLVRIELTDGENEVEPLHTFLHGVVKHRNPSYDHLDMNVTEDQEFMSELSLLNGIIKKVKSGAVSRDGMPDVYWFVLSGLHAVVDFHGPDSATTLEAKKLLKNTINKLNDAFVSAYNGRVLVSIVSSDVSHTRQTRSLMAEPETEAPPGTLNINLSKNYGADYPVIFNILLWFMIAFTFSILAVAIGIASMDPGRDSIIYRMTSNRMKKDN